MAKTGDSSTKKPRKKRSSINFKTTKEKEKSKTRLIQQNISSYGHGDPSASSSKENSTETVIATADRRGKTNTTRSKSHRFTSPSKPLSSRNEVKPNEGAKQSARTRRNKRKSINFIAPKDRTSSIRHQSVTGHTLTRGGNTNTNAPAFDSSTSSISKLSDTPGTQVDSLSSTFRTSSAVRQKSSQKRKLTRDDVQETTPRGQVKKRKTSKGEKKKTSPNTSCSLPTRNNRVKNRRKSNPVVLDRIRDLRVTKKSFEKWKPMSKVTIAFVEDTFKSVILNVISESNVEQDEEATRCLTMLKNKVIERLPNLKAPYTKGDYRNMESQNKLAENVYLEHSRELNVLDKKIEEQQRLLDTQMAKVADFTKKFEKYENELESLEREKAHPLIKQTKNVLNLQQLPGDSYIEPETSEEEGPEETGLRKTLLQLRQNTNDVGLERWMDKITIFTKSLNGHI